MSKPKPKENIFFHTSACTNAYSPYSVAPNILASNIQGQNAYVC